MGDTTAMTVQPPRPLPSVPGKDPAKPPSSNTVAEPTTTPAKPPPPKHVNAVAGPSKHPHHLVLLSPTSKVLLTQTPAHKPKTTSVSMRYQPLVAGTSAEPASKDTTCPSSSVRLLPRIPPPAPPPRGPYPHLLNPRDQIPVRALSSLDLCLLWAPLAPPPNHRHLGSWITPTAITSQVHGHPNPLLISNTRCTGGVPAARRFLLALR